MKYRFEPSCSEYMILSIEKYGIFKESIRAYLVSSVETEIMADMTSHDNKKTKTAQYHY
ncbi:MAG: membrane protein insertion efficiency factor YidD [Lachnospiraceae bacterium]